MSDFTGSLTGKEAKMRFFVMPITAALLAPIMSAPSSQAAAQDISGAWARGDGNARVRIAPCGDAICAVNTWVRDESSGEHVGDRLVMRVSGEGPTMSGTAYDPQRKLNYNLEITLGAQSMTTRGCVLAGVICKSISWSRASR
jgi:uncharacterized protein (DUF2147 family)